MNTKTLFTLTASVFAFALSLSQTIAAASYTTELSCKDDKVTVAIKSEDNSVSVSNIDCVHTSGSNAKCTVKLVKSHYSGAVSTSIPSLRKGSDILAEITGPDGKKTQLTTRCE